MAPSKSPPPVTKETRDRIFAAAAKLFAARGYRSVAMREIADAAGVSKPMLYYYFESKAGLCKTLLEEGFAIIHRAMEEATRAQMPLEERLQFLVREQFRHVREHPDLVRFHIHFMLGPDETGLAAEFRTENRPIVHALEDMVTEGKRKGLFRADVDPKVAVNVFAGAVNIHIGRSLLLGGPPLDDALADHVTRLYLHGICA